MGFFGWLTRLVKKEDSHKKDLRGNAVEMISRPAVKYVLLSLVWFVMVAALTAAMIEYSSTPGKTEIHPLEWPQNGSLTFSKETSTLLMFAHPHCPCTKASLEELSKLMAKCRGLVSGFVILSVQEGTPDGWAETDIKRIASNISGIKVVIDKNSVLTRKFGCQTSGSTLLYGRDGRLLFHGGITLARGHEGDNAGRIAIQEILHGRTAQHNSTPVFGCGLLDSVCVMGDVN